MLGIEPEKTIYDLVIAPGELDPEKLAGYTTKHKSGLDILPAPLRPEDAELVTEAKLGRLIEVARATYDAIVVDTSPFFHGPMLATLDRTDELLARVRPRRADAEERPARPGDARDAVVPAGACPRGAEPREQQGRHEAARGRGGARGQGALRGALRPSRPAVGQQGRPAVLSDPGSDFSRSIEAMAKGIFPKEEAKRGASRLRPSFARAG